MVTVEIKRRFVTPEKIERDSWLLSPREIEFFQEIAKERELEGKPQVLWGWKRDLVVDERRYPESRTVYFSADLDTDGLGNLFIKRAFFFLDTRAEDVEIAILREQVGKSRDIGGYWMEVNHWTEPRYEGYDRLRIEVGEPTEYDQETVARRLKGSPRLKIEQAKLIPESYDYNLGKYAPFAVYCGSGLSAESGLPLLGTIHSLFEVDDLEKQELVFGAKDGLPALIVRDVDGEFRKLCQFTVDAIKAEPSRSHERIAELYQKGVIKEVFTDNLDDLLRKVDVPHTQTRLGIFPDRFHAQFDPEAKSLLVIGVAVDRREVIKQARRAGLKIIAINPVMEVAPHSRNIDYLYPGDIFFRETAASALPKIISTSGF